jgi:restriction endonuclease S subunit
VFLISRGEIIERFDAIYYSASNSLKIANETTYPIKKLSDVAILQRGRFSHRPRNDERFYHGNYPFIQTGDIVRASETNDTIEFTQTLNERGLSVSKLFKPDILIITIAANIGDTAILTYPACFPDSLVTITPKNELVDVRYLNVYFKYVKDYLVNLAPQAAQKNINLQQLSPTPIVIPPIETQSNIIALFEAAYQTKKQKETEATKLLASIDGYLLNALGITLPPPSDKKTYFMSNSGQVSGGRFDPFYHQDEFENFNNALRKTRFNLEKINNICFDIRGVTYSNTDEAITGKKILRANNIDLKTNDLNLADIRYIRQDFEISGNQRLYKNDIFMCAASGSKEHSGKVAFIEYDTDFYFGGFMMVLRSKDNVFAKYLFEILGSTIFRKFLIKILGGTNINNLNFSMFKSYEIPLPPLEKQTEIANHISAIRAKAKQLQHEAKAELEQVKSVIEKMILGEQYE